MKIYGVSVLPPSVCIVLEICLFGSLSDVIRGINFTSIYSTTGSIRESFGSHISAHSNQTYNAGGDNDTCRKRPPLNLTLSDKYFLALGKC